MGLTQEQLADGTRDLREMAIQWRLWNLLAWRDIKQRYRRSTLGPLWLTISMAIHMIVIGVLFTTLFKSPYEKFLPFLAAGLIFWGLIQGIINEGAGSFLGSSNFILQFRRPLSIYVAQTVWRNVIVLGHNFIIYIVIAIIFKVVPSLTSIWIWPLGILLVVLCVSSVALIAAIISVRYRDFPMILTNIFTALFWLTPIMYYPSLLGNKQYLLNYNPFTHLLALVRDPLLGQSPPMLSWVVVLGLTFIGWSCAFFLFSRLRARIVYWL
jgi:lipopolysaccharide transport system permease protein